MKKLMTLTLFGISLLNADVVDDSYRSLISKSIFISNTSLLKSGYYEFEAKDGDKPELTNSAFVGSHLFGDEGDLWRVFVEGGFGFSKIEQNDISVGRGVVGDDVELESVYLKGGLGLQYSPRCDFGFIVGGNVIYMETDGSYSTSQALGSSTIDEKLKKYFDSDSTNIIYSGYGGFVYTPELYGHKTKLKALLHYTKINFDYDLDDADGLYFSVLGTLHGDELGRIWGQPLWLDYYAGADFVSGDISDLVGFKSAFTAGTSLNWQVGPLIPFVRDYYDGFSLSLNLQGTVGDNDFKGWKAGVGISFAKF